MRTTRFLQLLHLLALLTLVGCGGKPLNYTSEAELMPGPGLLSGEDGVFTLYEQNKRESAEVKE